MDSNHREVMDAFYSDLAQPCNMDLLLPLLVERNVFSEEESQRYKNPNESRNLFRDVQSQGVDAFPNLVASLREIDQGDLALVLEKNVEVIPGTELFDDNAQAVVPAYSTHSKNRGHVLIINIINYPNNKQRNGAGVDAKNLKELFEDMGFTVTPHTNLTGKNMMEAIELFATNPQLEDVDMVFVIIMGHGSEKYGVSNILGTDNKEISTKWVEDQFDNNNCRSLQRKPRIFIYQSCRGNNIDYAKCKSKSAGFPNLLRTREDMLIAHSTLPGNLAGSWYIQIFCEVVTKHAHNTHLDDIFKKVDYELTKRRPRYVGMQTCQTRSNGFNKHCYLHPKIYKKDGEEEIRNIHDDSLICNTSL